MARKVIALLMASSLSLASIQHGANVSSFNSKAFDYELLNDKIQRQRNIGYESIAYVGATYPSDISVGMIDWFEGCIDTLTWPGLYSGPTIGCGIDLGNIGRNNTRKIFTNVVDSATLEKMLSASSVRGVASKAWIRDNNTVRLSNEQVLASRDRMLGLMWRETERKFPGISDAPGEVKTAVLSVILNRGPYNKTLAKLGQPIRIRDYIEVSRLIASMSDDHEMPGLKRRRSIEADMILWERDTNAARQ